MGDDFIINMNTNTASVLNSNNNESSMNIKKNRNNTKYGSNYTSYYHSTSISSSKVFDKCFNCSTQLSWFLFRSKADKIGSSDVNHYVVCIRFFIPVLISNNEDYDKE